MKIVLLSETDSIINNLVMELRNADIQSLKELVCSDNGGIGTGVIITED